MPRADRALRGAPLRRAAARRRAHRDRHGQHAAHARSLPHAARSGRHGDAARSDLRELRGPARLRRCPACKIVRLRVLDPADVVVSARDAIPPASRANSRGCSTQHRPRLVLFGAPDNPTSQVVPQALAELMLANAPRTPARGWRSTSPTSASTSRRRRRITRGRRPIIRTSSAFTRTRSGRAGWAGGSAGSKRHTPVVDAIERVQQCSILCPDTLSQMAMARYLKARDRRRIAEAVRGGRERALQERRAT